jgi:hypothetical protein
MDEIFDTIKHYTNANLPQDGRHNGRGDAAAMLFAKVYEKGVIIHGLQDRLRRDGEKTKTWIGRVISSLDPCTTQDFPAVPTAHLEHLAADMARFIAEVSTLKILTDAYVSLVKDNTIMDDLLA